MHICNFINCIQIIVNKNKCFTVNGGWRPFVSKECAYRGPSESEELTFFIPYSAACVTIRVSLTYMFCCRLLVCIFFN